MEIKISKQEIFNEVEKRSSLEGFSIPDRYDAVWANDTRGELLDSFWVEGCAAIVQLLKRYLSSVTSEHVLDDYNKDEVFTLKAELPIRYNINLEGSIITSIKMMLACNILHGWLEVTAPDAAAKYDEESKGYSEDLRVKLLYREAPITNVSTAKSDEVEFESGEYLPTAKSDEVILTQGWGKCDCKECVCDNCLS